MTTRGGTQQGACRRVGAALVLAATMAACGTDSDSRDSSEQPGETPPQGSVTQSRVLDPAARRDQWLVGGGNFEKHHYSPLDDINRDNVSRLGPKWALDIDSPMGLGSEPIIADGVAYISAPLSVVYAVDLHTGKPLWRFQPELDLTISLLTSYTARANRGVAVWNGRVYVGTGDCRVIAIDALTGTRDWDVRACDPAEAYGAGINSAPRVGDGKLFVGYAGAETGVRGSVAAIDAEDGTELWRFYTVPGDPALGFENAAMERASKTWDNGWPPMGGGVAWDAITYDPVTRLVFIGTAGSIPYAVNNRNPGGGDMLYTNSIVAVDADTGEYAWHYQTVPNDTWDFDASMHMLVAEVPIDGERRRVVMQAPKNGFFYALDAATGELLRADAIVPTNWASHIDVETGRPVELPGARYYKYPDQVTRVYPSVSGAHNWQAMSLNPDNGLVYIPANELGSDWGVTENGEGWYDASSFDKEGNVIENVGRLIAWDTDKQEARWKAVLKQAHNGGTLATAGGLVFLGETTGALAAYDADSGEQLWKLMTGSSIVSNPASVEIDGEQLIVVTAGRGSALTMASNELTVSDESRNGAARLIAFALDGRAELPQGSRDPVPVPRPYRKPDKELVAAGKELFKAALCTGCHGNNAYGVGSRLLNGGVPDLRYVPEDIHEQWLGVLMGASLDKGMPSYAGQLEVEDAKAIQEYVLYQSWNEYCKQAGEGITAGDPYCNSGSAGSD